MTYVTPRRASGCQQPYGEAVVTEGKGFGAETLRRLGLSPPAQRFRGSGLDSATERDHGTPRTGLVVRLCNWIARRSRVAQWLQVNLDATCSISRVRLDWEVDLLDVAGTAAKAT
jgi:hypothetical protein